MECYLIPTENGSPQWRLAVKRKAWARKAALSDPQKRKDFVKRYGHDPTEVTLDEVAEARNHE